MLENLWFVWLITHCMSISGSTFPLIACVDHMRGWCLHFTVQLGGQAASVSHPPSEKRANSDIIAMHKGLNPNYWEWSPKGNFIATNTVSAAPASKLVPNIMFCIPLNHISKVERGILMIGQPRFSIIYAQACVLKRSLESHYWVGKQHRSLQFTGYKSYLTYMR